jgi:hypothetical protein
VDVGARPRDFGSVQSWSAQFEPSVLATFVVGLGIIGTVDDAVAGHMEAIESHAQAMFPYAALLTALLRQRREALLWKT